jgi:hypothetical protein
MRENRTCCSGSEAEKKRRVVARLLGETEKERKTERKNYGQKKMHLPSTVLSFSLSLSSFSSTSSSC